MPKAISTSPIRTTSASAASIPRDHHDHRRRWRRSAGNCAAFPAASPHLFNPADVLPLPNGNLVIADQQNNRILQISPSGTVTTIAGNGVHNLFVPGNPATASPMDWPSALAVDSAGLIYFSELHSNRIGRINADGKLATVAGNGFPGTATLTKPTGIAIDRDGNVLIADTGNHRIRKVTPNGILTTIAGTGTQSFCGDGGPALAACFDTPMDVKLDSRGNIYIADTGNHRIRRIDAASGTITTVAAGTLNTPCAIALDANDNLYIVDWQNFLHPQGRLPRHLSGRHRRRRKLLRPARSRRHLFHLRCQPGDRYRGLQHRPVAHHARRRQPGNQRRRRPALPRLPGTD